MNKHIANLISLVFHPLLMPTFVVLILMWLAPALLRPVSSDLYFDIILIVSITSLIIPALMLSTLRVTAVIPDLQLANRNNRIIPFIFIGIIYGVSTYMFYSQFSFVKILYVSYFATTVLIMVITSITFFWKISVHSSAIGGVLGIIYAVQQMYPELDFRYTLSVIALCVGIVGSSRLALDMHDNKQVVWGAVLGFAICFVLIYLGLKIG